MFKHTRLPAFVILTLLAAFITCCDPRSIRSLATTRGNYRKHLLRRRQRWDRDGESDRIAGCELVSRLQLFPVKPWRQSVRIVHQRSSVGVESQFRLSGGKSGFRRTKPPSRQL